MQGRGVVPGAGGGSAMSTVSQHPRIIVLAQSSEERIGLVRLVLKNLPDSAKIVGTTTGGEIDQVDEQKKIMKALLLSIKEEARLINAMWILGGPSSSSLFSS